MGTYESGWNRNIIKSITINDILSACKFLQLQQKVILDIGRDGKIIGCHPVLK